MASPATDDAFPIVDASEKEVKQITYAELSAAIGSTVDIAAMIHAATSKTTPIDADELGIWDSVSAALRKLTWANTKATLKTYFDGIYGAIAKEHDRQHAITDTADHTSTATPGQMLKADANGLPVDAAMSEANVVRKDATSLLATAAQLQFRDTAIYIISDTDGWMNLHADVGVEINAPIVNCVEIYASNGLIPVGTVAPTTSTNALWIDTN